MIRRLRWKVSEERIREYYWEEMEYLKCEVCGSDVDVYEGMDWNWGDVEVCSGCRSDVEFCLDFEDMEWKKVEREIVLLSVRGIVVV